MALLTPGTVNAQVAAKLSAPKGVKAAVVAQTAKKAPVKTDARGFMPLTKRSVKSPLKTAKTVGNLIMPNKKAPVKLAEAANLPTLNGYIIYEDDWSNSYAPEGLYNVSSANTELILAGPASNYGNIEVDGYIYTVKYIDYGFFAWVEVDVYDAETGELVANNDDASVGILAPAGFATDPTTGTVYGISYNDEGNALRLASFSFSPDGTVTPTNIAAISGNWNSIACDAQGQLYGISYVGETQGEDFVVTSSSLNKIDKTTGAVTVVGETGKYPLYLSSSCIDPKSGRMFWNVCSSDETGWLCEVNLTTGEATNLFQYAKNSEIMGMYVPAPAAEETAPAAVTDLVASFPEGSLNGTISFTAPETLYNGTVGEGALTYKIVCDGEEDVTGTTSFGAQVTVAYTAAVAGAHKFVVTVANEAGESPKAKVSVFVGNGIPAAPTSVSLVYEEGNLNLTWAAVTTSVDGGYINPAEVTYTVTRFPENVVVVSGTKETSFSEPYDAETASGKVFYEVVASYAGINSAVATSNGVALGSVTPPYSNELSTIEDLDEFTVIDANGDGKTWVINSGAARVAYNSSKAMDDWLISPALKLEAGKMYQFTCETKAQSTSYVEKIEVLYGRSATAEGMTNELVPVTEVKTTTYEEIGGYIIPEETGTYYVGIHGVSDADKYYLYVKNFSVGAGQSAAAPAAVTELTVTPDATGELNATVSFKAPETTIGGAALTGDVLVELKRDGNMVNTATVAPGASVEVVDNVPVAGTYEYTVTASNEAGVGIATTVSAYIGVKAPAAPENVTISEEGNTGYVTLTWDAVTTDENGDPINVSKLGYLVCEYAGGWYAISDTLTDTTYSFQAVEEGEQDFVYYGVFAVTEGGNNGAVSEMIAVGTPYNGMEESFADGGLSYILGTGFSVKEGAWGLYTDSFGIPSCDGDNGYAGMKGQSLDSSSALFTGKISLEGMTNPGVSFYTYNIVGENPDINEIQLYVMEAGSNEWVELGAPVVVNDLNPGEEGWQMVMVSLEAYANKTVQVRFQATTKQYVYTLIDQIKVGNQLGHDLKVKGINAPAFVNSGAEYTLNVVVGNSGTQSAETYSVTLYTLEGEEVAVKECEALASGASATVSFNLVMSPVAEEAVSYYAVVNYADDEDLANNRSEAIAIAPKLSKLPKVTDLAAERVDEGVKLTWSEPDLSSAPVESGEVDFEDADSFAMEYGDWTFVDVDGLPVGGFQGIDLPGITPGETLASFFVFDTSGDEFNQSFDAHSGNMFIATLFQYQGQTIDEWAISPLLSGDAQEISFWAKSYSSSYPEKIEMYYSMNSTDVADFVQVGTTVNPVPGDWTQYTFEVPAGAKYFAIRSCATDSFMLMLDDFSFSAAGGASADLSIVGYDIYRDGVKINEEPVAETEYVDTEVESGTYTYVVLAVYETGVSAPSNKAVIDVQVGIDGVKAGVKVVSGKGAIAVTGAAGEALAVMAADGKVLYSGVASDKEVVSVPAGVYVVRAGNKTVKVAVK